MAQTWAKDFYKSSSWQQCREAFGVSRFWICERCGRPGDIVHHKVPLTIDNITDPSVALGWDNLELLCQDCHNREHAGGGWTRQGLAFDENGDLVPVIPPHIETDGQP